MAVKQHRRGTVAALYWGDSLIKRFRPRFYDPDRASLATEMAVEDAIERAVREYIRRVNGFYHANPSNWFTRPIHSYNLVGVDPETGEEDTPKAKWISERIEQIVAREYYGI